jgi:hypothetical protein
MVVMDTRPMNTNIMRRRVVDRRGSILRVIANQLLFAASSLAALCYLFPRPQSPKAWPALVNHEHHRGSAAVCARADALRHVARGCALPRSNIRGMVALLAEGHQDLTCWLRNVRLRRQPGQAGPTGTRHQLQVIAIIA